jgi:hypothetical protein
MPNSLFRPSASGLFWSVISSWVTSSDGVGTWGPANSLPDVTDEVYLDGKSIYWDYATSEQPLFTTQPIKAKFITNRARTGTPSTAASGSISCSIAGVVYNITSSFILGSGSATTFPSTTGLINLNSGAHSLTLNISGNIDARSSSVADNTRAVISANATDLGNFKINIVGNVYSGAVGSGIYLSSNFYGGVITVYGNVFNSGSGYGILCIQRGTTVIITGSVQSSGSNPTILAGNSSNDTTAQIIVSGSVSVSNSAPTTGSAPALSFGTTVLSEGRIIGNVTAGASSSAVGSLSFTPTNHIWYVYGSLISDPTNSRTPIYGGSVYVSQSYTINNTDGTTTLLIPQSNPYPSITNVRLGSPAYGDSSQYNGSMVIPNVTDVRYSKLVNTGSATGSIRIPSSSDVRYGILFDTGSIGTLIMPSSSFVSKSLVFDNGDVGTYDGIPDFWGFAVSSITTPGSIGALITSSLNVPLGSISASFINALDDPNTSSPTVKRLQNLARVQDMGDQVASSSYV